MKGSVGGCIASGQRGGGGVYEDADVGKPTWSQHVLQEPKGKGLERQAKGERGNEVGKCAS